MEQNHETIEGEVISEETIESKKKFVFNPLAKKALIIGGAVVGLIVGLALLSKDEEPSETTEEDDISIETVDNLDGTSSVIITGSTESL
jgi:hypothetical protein